MDNKQSNYYPVTFHSLKVNLVCCNFYTCICAFVRPRNKMFDGPQMSFKNWFISSIFQSWMDWIDYLTIDSKYT